MSGSSELTDEEAKQVVFAIARSKGWVEPRLLQKTDPDTLTLLRTIQSTREQLGHAIETIARDIYSQKARYILELIQNAEDCEFGRSSKAPSITFEVQPEKITIEYNEDGFTEADVEGICRVGNSLKRPKHGYIGNKGIGFKSVFQVASRVQIQSNAFSFCFEYNGGQSSEEKLKIITPIPEDEPIPPVDRPLTRMKLIPNQSIPYEELVDEFLNLPDTLLLFLAKIKVLKIKIQHSDNRTTSTTWHRLDHSERQMIQLTKSVENGDDVTTEELYFHIAKKSISGLPHHDARPGIDECEIVLAFPLDDESKPIISNQDVYSFLPVRKFGFKFLIQADFILDASRQDVVNLERNRVILDEIAKTFRDAVLKFCEGRTALCYDWVKFLPSDEVVDSFWKSLSQKIIEALSREKVLYVNNSNELQMPEDLRTLSDNHLDAHRSPLLEDHTDTYVKYLSLQYGQDIATLARLFNIPEIGDEDILNKIGLDLLDSRSRMKNFDSGDDWHTRTANLILAILGRSPHLRDRILALRLIPMSNGQWETALSNEIYFPSESGPEIPRDLLITIDQRAYRNAARKSLFINLGINHPPTQQVIQRLLTRYATGNGADDLSSSVEHIKYLYWNDEEIDDFRFRQIWLYATDERKVKPRLKTLYLQSNDEYGAQELLRPVFDPQDPTRRVAECAVTFINSAYMTAFPSSLRRHDLTWLAWLEIALEVRRIPRLKTNGGALSNEFRYISRYRPDKLVGTLKKYWDIYRDYMSPPIVESLSQLEVASGITHRSSLRGTYLPLPDLKKRVEHLGILYGFPFLVLPNTSDATALLRDWRFLAEFNVGIEEDLHFYIEVLRLHQSRRPRLWNSDAQSNILRTYRLIIDYCRSNEEDQLQQMFNEGNLLILDPRSFQEGALRPIWTDIDEFIWNGPQNLLDKTPLASVPQYRDDARLVRLFRQVLEIPDATWKEYLATLSKFRRNSDTGEAVLVKILRIYQFFTNATLSVEAWEEIKDSFEKEGLIYIHSNSTWFPPSQCLWSTPIPIEGKGIIGDSYPDELQPFFLKRLEIQPASLSTLIEELQALSQRQPSISAIKEMIAAINTMDLEQGDLDSLLTFNIFPVRKLNAEGNYSFSLQNYQGDFVIIDRNPLADIFDGHVSFLDYTLEEVQQLYPFLHTLNLDDRYLSGACKEETACSEDGTLDRTLTDRFVKRAYYLLRCAFSFRSPLTTRDPQLLYEKLSTTSIFKTDCISTRYTLRQASGDKVLDTLGGYVHIQHDNNVLKIFVPQDRKNEKICYLRYLPEALCTFFQVDFSAREIIGNLLSSSVPTIEALLEVTGLGKVPGVSPISQTHPDVPDDGESEEEIEVPEQSLQSDASAENTESASGNTRDDTSQSHPETVLTPIRSPSPNAYLGLLDHVIQIASQRGIPHRDFVAENTGSQVYFGINYEAAFGDRSQDQLSHNIKVGAAGELFAFEILSRILPSSFGRENWTSSVREEVSIHPNYSDLRHFWGAKTADIMYEDVNSTLTNILIEQGYLDEIWSGAHPRYFIGVHSTPNVCRTRFFMTHSQYQTMQRIAFAPGQIADEVYIIFRVYNLTKESLNVKLYMDRNDLEFEAETWIVTPRV